MTRGSKPKDDGLFYAVRHAGATHQWYVDVGHVSYQPYTFPKWKAVQLKAQLEQQFYGRFEIVPFNKHRDEITS